jgi:hypothetical protein
MVLLFIQRSVVILITCAFADITNTIVLMQCNRLMGIPLLCIVQEDC